METENLPVPLIDNQFDSLANIYAEDVVEPTERDVQLIEEMAAIGCTAREIAGVLKLTLETLKNNAKAKDACLRGAERAKVSLRRLQWKTAQKNPIMQIFLGKQILGQADKVEHKNDDKELEKARKSFEDKLKNIIDVTPKRRTTQSTKRKRIGSRKESVVDVGEGGTTPTTG